MTTTTTTATGTYQGKTAAEWRAAAAEENRRRNESWDRCDTDGFVSQWAHQITASEYELKAQLAESDSMTEVSGLFDLDGNLIDALHGWSQYGEYWMLLDADGNNAGFFNPSQARNEATARKNNARKGFYVGTVRVPARVDIVGGGSGLAGAASCYAAIIPASKVITFETAEVVDNGK